jgi:ABC-type transporter Mla maintaining outer membrane lipid asymmetry ATPase subunit MlaF
LRGLTKRYGEETVVDTIAASIAPGEFFSLLGPSGRFMRLAVERTGESQRGATI